MSSRVIALAALLAACQSPPTETRLPAARVLVEDASILSFGADEDYVYWSADPGGIGAAQGRILRRLRSGGEAEVLADGQFSPYLFVGAQTVYWAEFDWGSCVRIWALEKSGGTPRNITPIVDGNEACPSHQFLAEDDGMLLALARDEAYGHGSLIAIDPSGSRPVTVRRTFDVRISQLILLPNGIFALVPNEIGEGAYVAKFFDGSDSAHVVVSDLRSPRGIVVTGTHIFWTEGASVMSYRMLTGERRVLAELDEGSLGAPTLVGAEIWIPVELGGTLDGAWLRVSTETGTYESIPVPYAPSNAVADGDVLLMLAGAFDVTRQILEQPLTER